MKDSLCVGIVAEGRRISCDRYFDYYLWCSGSVTFWYGSGSADQYRWFTDPDHALFFSRIQQKVFLLISYHRYIYIRLQI
jgi:hypothetical protein